MIQRFYFSSRYGTYLRSEHGVKKFAEMCMAQLIRKVTKKSAFYREENENLLVEKANLRLRQNELSEQEILTPGQYFGVRRRLWATSLLLTAVVVAAILIFMISILAFVTPEAGLPEVLRVATAAVLAVVLAGGGLVVSERLIEAFIPVKYEAAVLGVQRTSVGVLWAFLLAGVLLAITGIASVSAASFVEEAASGLLFYGYMALAIFLPVVAGALRWDSMQYVDRYKTTRAHRQIDSRLAQIDSIQRQNEEYESNFFKLKSIYYWNLLNDFKTYKDVYNERHGIVESLDGHFSQTYDAFQAEANKRYESDIRDVTSKSMRRLDVRDRHAVGSKLGQPAPRLSGNPEGDRASASSESDAYMRPKPVR